MNYVIFLDNKPFGNAEVEKVGLYWHIRCRVHLKTQAFYRLILFSEKGETDLGLCVQMGSGFGINTAVPIKKAGCELNQFILRKENTNSIGCFYPIIEGQTFANIIDIPRGRFVRKQGIPGIYIE